MDTPIYTAETGCTLSGTVITGSGTAATGAQTFDQANDASGMPLTDTNQRYISIYDSATPAWAVWLATYDNAANTWTRVGSATQENGTLASSGLTVALFHYSTVVAPSSDGNYYAYKDGAWVNITNKLIDA